MAGLNQNFFDESTVDNPFKDSSIQEIIMNSRNPFSYYHYEFNSINMQEPSTSKNTQVSQKDHNYHQNKKTPETEELIRKLEELERKERELVEREERLRHSALKERRSNWPPLSDKCCFQPCFYQDIQVDIPPEFQRIVSNLYHLWIFHAVLFMLNIIGGIVLGDFNIIGEGLFYFLLFTPFGYICWFRPAYKAFRSDSSFNFILFFFMFFFQLIISCIHAIGATGCGTIGIITAIITVNNTNVCIFPKIVVVVIASCFVCAATADLYLISKIHRIYRNTGASIEKAQQEFRNDFLQTVSERNSVSGSTG